MAYFKDAMSEFVGKHSQATVVECKKIFGPNSSWYSLNILQ
jgi:hypothetical protein